MNDRKSGQNLPVFTCDSKDLIDCDFAVTKTSFVELRFMIKDSTTMLMKLKAFLVILWRLNFFFICFIVIKWFMDLRSVQLDASFLNELTFPMFRCFYLIAGWFGLEVAVTVEFQANLRYISAWKLCFRQICFSIELQFISKIKLKRWLFSLITMIKQEWIHYASSSKTVSINFWFANNNWWMHHAHFREKFFRLVKRSICFI